MKHDSLVCKNLFGRSSTPLILSNMTSLISRIQIIETHAISSTMLLFWRTWPWPWNFVVWIAGLENLLAKSLRIWHLTDYLQNGTLAQLNIDLFLTKLFILFQAWITEGSQKRLLRLRDGQGIQHLYSYFMPSSSHQLGCLLEMVSSGQKLLRPQLKPFAVKYLGHWKLFMFSKLFLKPSQVF